MILRVVRAEEEGFEPPVPHGTTVFKTAAFDRSATPLYFLLNVVPHGTTVFAKADAKVAFFLIIQSPLRKNYCTFCLALGCLIPAMLYA